jgi:hypothetical protein
MICTACGKTNVDSALFCEQCGTGLRPQPAGSGVAAPALVPGAPVPVSTGQFAQSGEALIAAMSTGEKVSGAGAIAAIIGFFLPWISYATAGVAATAQTSYSGLDLGKVNGSVYLILLNAGLAAVLCYMSSKAAPPRKLIIAGYLAFIGALCGPATLTALIFVSKLSAVAGAGMWVFALGYTAIAVGGLMSIRDFSKRVF